jgi:hypothetical protein
MRFLLAGLLLTALGLLAAPSVEATHAMPCPDLNGDGTLTVVDVTILASYMGWTVPPAPIQADMDLDGDVDQDDVDYFFLPIYKPWPNFTFYCQDTPIGAAGAVGGETALADVEASGDAGLPMLTIAAAGLVASLSVVVLAVARRR